MVWIKLNPDSYLNSELVTAIRCVKIGSHNVYGTQIICAYDEFGNETYPENERYDTILWDIEDLPKIGFHEEISETAREILARLIIELETAKKNGDVIFNLDDFIEESCIKYRLCRNPQSSNKDSSTRYL